jgi:ferredoxin
MCRQSVNGLPLLQRAALWRFSSPNPFWFMAVLALSARKVVENVPGAFGVTESCIDCDLCRQTAPSFFKRHHVGNAGHSFVWQQPRTPEEISLCEDALRSCPVEAIVHDAEF